MTRAIHSFFTFLLCIGLDWLWLAVFSGDLLNYRAAAWFQPVDLLFYTLLTSGLVMFSVYPALYVNDRNIALFNGAAFGFATFGLYEVVSSFWYFNYPVTLAVVDTLWGTLAGALLGLASFQIGRWMDMSGSRMPDVEMDQGMFLE